MPVDIRPIVFGGRLFALRKKDSSLRPIACSSTLRRIAAKIACRENRAAITESLGAHQLGFGRKGGTEAVAHAARSFVSSCPPGFAFLKLDFRNAFNTLRRDHLLRVVRDTTHELFHLVEHAYREPTSLFFEYEILTSASGSVQQGDPLGPALFGLGIQRLADSIEAPFNAWCLD